MHARSLLITYVCILYRDVWDAYDASIEVIAYRCVF